MSATIYRTAKGHGSALTFRRVRFDIARHHGAPPESVEGYRPEYPAKIKTYAGGTPTPQPWGITDDGKRGGRWTVYHLPTGLRIRGGIESLDAAKSLVLTFAQSTATEAWNLSNLAALPFGKAPEKDSPAYAEALGIFKIMRAWIEERAVFG